MKKLGVAVLALALLYGAALVHGYLQARATGYLSIFVRDGDGWTSKEPLDIAMKDSSGAIIGEGFFLPARGYLQWKFPGHEECDAAERTQPQTAASRAKWRECVEVFMRWHRDVGEATRKVDINWRACKVTGLALPLKIDWGSWMTWWIPLPHIGGTPHTTYSAHILLDTRACSARVETF